jgi:transcriptional regulator GlxA family with amidase domain
MSGLSRTDKIGAGQRHSDDSYEPKTARNVAILLFQHVDILDFTGPLEIFACATHIPRSSFAFNTALVAATPNVKANSRGCLTVTADMTIDEARRCIGDFDILVVPGANPEVMMQLGQGGGDEVEFVRAFDRLPASKGGKERIILSVCTGALLVAKAGALSGMRATTHHLSLGLLEEIDERITVMGADTVAGRLGRYVDGGRNKNETRLVTAGGVTCGLDASLFVVEVTAGRGAADEVARMMEHTWKRV